MQRRHLKSEWDRTPITAAFSGTYWNAAVIRFQCMLLYVFWYMYLVKQTWERETGNLILKIVCVLWSSIEHTQTCRVILLWGHTSVELSFDFSPRTWAHVPVVNDKLVLFIRIICWNYYVPSTAEHIREPLNSLSNLVRNK